jgi:two-component system phosphate regulon response regulator OmpR
VPARLRKNGEELPLTTGEFAMLKALVRHPRQPLSREKLAQLARGREFEPFDRKPGRAGLAPAQADRSRSRLAALHPDRVGVGYVFVPDGAG